MITKVDETYAIRLKGTLDEPEYVRLNRNTEWTESDLYQIKEFPERWRTIPEHLAILSQLIRELENMR